MCGPYNITSTIKGQHGTLTFSNVYLFGKVGKYIFNKLISCFEHWDLGLGDHYKMIEI